MAVIASGQITIIDVSDGVGIASTQVKYYLSTSATSLVGGSWQDTAPQWTSGKYIWTKTVVTYDDDNQTTTESNPVCITGNAGVGVSSIVAEYYLSTSSSTQTGGSWKTTPDPWEYGKFLWTRSKITYTTGAVEYTTPYCDSSWTAVDNISLGGRNYIRNSVDMVLEGTHMIVALS